jgi:hypothetical protein
MRYSLVEVERFPKPLEPGTLYWSKEFEVSAHLCACGCRDVIYLPVGPVDYSITLDRDGPTLRPSVGNWNVCNAHYFITNGSVQWAKQWTKEQISSSRSEEDARRAAYYALRPDSLLRRLLRYARALVRRVRSGRQ